MTDSPRPEEVEQSLRDALSVRAEDLAAGDGAPWDPYRQRSAVVALGAETAARHGLGWWTIAAAVAAIALPVAGGAFLLVDGAERTNPPAVPACAPPPTTTSSTTTDPRPPTTAGPTSTAPATTASAVGEPTTAVDVQAFQPITTTTVPAGPTTTAPTTTTDPCAPPTECDQPWVVSIGDDPTEVVVGESGQLVVRAILAGDADPAWRAGNPEVGPAEDPPTEIITTESGGSAVEVVVGELLFVAEGVDIPEPELLALAATVEPRTPDSLSYTPPCGAVPTTTP